MSKKIKLSKKNRICKFLGCSHVLSIYNPEAYCHVHRSLLLMQMPSMPLPRH